jgi:hypothetical protein
MSKSQRDIEGLIETVSLLVNHVNNIKTTLGKVLVMQGMFHQKLYPELYDENGNFIQQPKTELPTHPPVNETGIDASRRLIVLTGKNS